MADKIAIVTGGAGGIGQAVATRLARAGFGMFILDKSEKAGKETAELLRQQNHAAEFYRVDLQYKTEVRDLFEAIYAKTKRIDVLVNLAGGTLHKNPIQDFSLSDWREVINVNLKGTFLCCQAVLKPMKTRKDGIIINTSSNFGITGSAGRTAYAAAKAAIIAFTKSLALEVAPFGVRANAIAPGLTATARVMTGHTETEWRELSKEIPMGRAADPIDIAEAVNFLASDESGYITGQLIHVNGGMVFT
jgi:NAD(P)-dependent dehydrogenase (short-subunit alcohol dehydrogenase family)